MNLLKVNAQEVLEKEHKASKDMHKEIIQNAGLNEVKGLLGYDENRHNQIMSKMGLNSVDVAVMNTQGTLLQLEKEEEYYGGKVFTSEQIKRLCINYRLKLLNTNLFKGKLDVQIVAKIREFEKQIAKSMTADQANKKQMSVEDYTKQYGTISFSFNDYDLQNKFFIMAPLKMFRLEKEKRELGIHRFGKFLNSMIPKDPILFYKVDDHKYKMVHKWGNDFSILRAVKGIIYKNETSLLLTRSLTIMAFAAMIVATFTNLFINSYFGYNVLTILAIVVLSPIITILSLPKSTSALYSENGWNQSNK